MTSDWRRLTRSTSAFHHIFIHLGIFSGRLGPPVISRHSVAHQLFPGLFIFECHQRAIDGIEQPPRIQPFKLKAGPGSLLWMPLIDRVVETACGPDNGRASILERVNLVEPARLIPRWHQEHIRPSLDLVRKRFVVTYLHSHLALVPEGPVA